MKKRIVSFILSALMLLPLLLVGTPALAEEAPKAAVTAPEGNAPAAFAVGEINKALEQANDAEGWTVTLQGVDETLGAQAYKVTVGDKTVTVVGGDDAGLMYGGLEVAEEIALSDSIAAVKDSENTPDIFKRGIRYIVSMDMRTPGYSDPGDSNQANIEDVWDINFWHEYFDQLARFRINEFNLRTLNPLPNMVVVPGYEDLALNDVYKTTVPFDDSYSGRALDNFRKEHMEEGNYKVVKTISIAEKIDFWKEVMAYAHERGISFHIYFSNIYLFGEMGQFTDENGAYIPNKYGMTPVADNAATKDYLYKGIVELFKTYPDLDGIGVSAGENMTTTDDDRIPNEQWLYETYGKAINEYLESNPDRQIDVIRRSHWSGVEHIKGVWTDFKGTMCFEGKYTCQHMNASEKPNYIYVGKDSVVSYLDGETPMQMEIRNEDAYLLRLGDADYIRAMLSNAPLDVKPYMGFTVGEDGYNVGREYGFADESLNGKLYANKHWYFYELMGRLGYDLSLTNDFFRATFREHFNGLDTDAVDQLFDALALASGNVREVNKVNFNNHTDSSFYPELAISHPNTFGYLGIKRWVKSDLAQPDSGYMSIVEYCKAYEEANGEPTTELVTPVQACAIMREKSEKVLKIVEALEPSKPATYASNTEREFWDTLDDCKAWAYWGIFFSEKFLGAIDLRLYNDLQDTAYQDKAVEHLTNTLEAWKQFAAIYSAHYKVQRLDRHGLWDVNTLTEQIEKDIKDAQKWRPKKL